MKTNQKGRQSLWSGEDAPTLVGTGDPRGVSEQCGDLREQ